MVHGKARLARRRALSQLWFDDALIDEFVHGEPRDPLADREVRIVHGAPRLAESMLDRVAAESEGLNGDDSAVWLTPQFEIAELPSLRRPLPPAVVEPDSVLVPFALSPPLSVEQRGLRCPAPPDSPERQPVSQPATCWASSIQLAPRVQEREAGRRFDWVRFFGGVCAGGLAAAILIAVVTGS